MAGKSASLDLFLVLVVNREVYQLDLEETACCGYEGYFTNLGAEC